MKPTRANINAMIEALDAAPDDVTLEDMAKLALEAAWVEYEKRMKFVVVGQRYEVDGRKVTDDGMAVKFALPPSETRGVAMGRMNSIADGSGFRAWCLPIINDTPAKAKKTFEEPKGVDGDDRITWGKEIGRMEHAKVLANKCGHIDMDMESGSIMECRRQSGHPGGHGLWSGEINFDGISED